MIYAAEDHAFIEVCAFKSHKRRAIVADAKALDTLEIDAKENAQIPKRAYWLDNSHTSALLFDAAYDAAVLICTISFE